MKIGGGGGDAEGGRGGGDGESEDEQRTVRIGLHAASLVHICPSPRLHLCAIEPLSFGSKAS